MKWFRSTRGLSLLGLVVLSLFLMRPGVNQLRARVSHSLTRAIGRQVEISSVSLRLLPRPGFDLENFVVHDDPAFSAEPILRSDEVTASLRLTSLFRGRMEISRLTLEEPSLNLVRNREGHWNLEYLLQRAALTPVAPTNKPKSETRPEFPYIEVDRGRINFKYGLEKKQFALTDADCALFQDSENTWGLRLRARPMRTDANLSDTGFWIITGSWQRAQSLHETPLQFSLSWEGAQLGQASKLIYGRDMGWRGTAAISSEVSGTPSELTIAGNGSVDDFRRYDILGPNPLRLKVQCGSHYSSATQTFSKIICDSPVGDGALSFRGNIDISQDFPVYHLVASAQDVPIQAILEIARRSRTGIPADLLATGTLEGTIKVQREHTAKGWTREWEGGGETSEFRLQSRGSLENLEADKIHFSIAPRALAEKNTLKQRDAENASENRILVDPFLVTMGKEPPVTVQGWMSISSYNFNVNGSAPIQSLLRAGHLLGIPSPQFAAQGRTIFDLQMAEAWEGFRPPKVTGKVELRSVRGQIRDVSAPLEITSAEVLLYSDKVTVRNISAALAGTTWRGSLALPRPCAKWTCNIEFDLHADEIATDNLNKALNPELAERPWYRFLSPETRKSFPAMLRATGHLTADRVKIHKLLSTQVSANVQLIDGKLGLSNLRGSVLGGLHLGQWTADFTSHPPVYSGSGNFMAVSLSQLSSAMQDDWISGTASGNYSANASGLSGAELFDSATGTLHLDARNALVQHIDLSNMPSPLRLRHFDGDLTLRNEELNFENVKLDTAGGVYQLSGKASLDRTLNLSMTKSGARGFNITGTLRTPVISSTIAPATQAALKR